MRIDVINNAKRNVIAGVLNKTIVMVFPFIVRTIINLYLGSEYLGLNSLFNSLLTVLSLSELGFGTAVVYHMYKPVAENDTPLVCALLNFYRKVYRWVGLVILCVGLLLIPFLPKLINGTSPEGINLVGVYLIFLLNTVISYFLSAYLNSLLVVYQRSDVTSLINTVVTVGLYFCQIIVVVLTRNYFMYSVLLPVFTVINNIWIYLFTKKAFPQYKCYGTLGKEQLASIKKLIAGAFIQKASGVTRNALDSVCTSAFLGLSLTAIYNNYYTISNSITVFLSIIYNAVLGGIGNHIALKTKKENFQEMRRLDFLYLWISGWCSICLLCLYQPFMRIWMGDNMLLPMPAVIMFCTYFYLLKLGDIRCIYTDANGLWWEHRYRSIVEFILNVLLNVLLGKYFGIYGIIMATIITLVVCNYFWGTFITFRCYFEKDSRNEYFKYQAKYSIVSLIICALSYFVCSFIDFDSTFATIAIRALICTILPNIMYILIYCKTDEYKYVKDVVFTRMLKLKR